MSTSLAICQRCRRETYQWKVRQAAFQASLTADQMARLSHDPDNLVLDLLGKSTGPALVGLQEPVGGPFRR